MTPLKDKVYWADELSLCKPEGSPRVKPIEVLMVKDVADFKWKQAVEELEKEQGLLGR